MTSSNGSKNLCLLTQMIMKNPWFKNWGWLYVPISWQGALLSLLALTFCMQVFVAVDRHSHSVSDSLYGTFPYFACCFLLFNWVAAHRCSGAQSSSSAR